VSLFLFLVSGALLALPGKQAHAGDVLSAVRVLTNKATYGRGERIVVTIHNELTTVLYAPRREPYCSVISVQRLEAMSGPTQTVYSKEFVVIG
jgi:hypothetical protein